MKTLVPNYYKKFRCIADKCRHNCCIGWEIDIDEDTLAYYTDLPGDFGEKVRKNIDLQSECPHFILKERERCPFLEPDGLCEIIKNLGEDALCDICTDHPRFRNFFSDHTEMGLGLCCEEAARIILTSSDPFELVFDGEAFEPGLADEEKEMFDRREALFSVIRTRSLSVIERMERIASTYTLQLSELLPEKLKELYLSLERLDKKWTDLLLSIARFDPKSSILSDKEYSICFEQLLCYLIFRHFADGMYDERYIARIKFALSGVFLVASLCDGIDDANAFDIAEMSRMLSSEIEYSEENLDKLFDSL